MASRSITKNRPRRASPISHARRSAPRGAPIGEFLVLRGGNRLGERNVVAARFLEADFAHAVKRGSLRLYDLAILQRVENRVQIVDLDVQEGWSLASLGNQRHIVRYASVALVHHFCAPLLQGYESDFV